MLISAVYVHTFETDDIPIINIVKVDYLKNDSVSRIEQIARYKLTEGLWHGAEMRSEPL